MNNRQESDSPQDRELARRFKQMRQHEALDLPDLLAEDALAAREPINIRSGFYGAVPKVAAALAVVAVWGVLTIARSPGDPVSVYADIMNANTMATDQLMSVSRVALPETMDMPGAYDLDMFSGPTQQMN